MMARNPWTAEPRIARLELDDGLDVNAGWCHGAVGGHHIEWNWFFSIVSRRVECYLRDRLPFGVM
jgi:hypothetical protein